MTNIEFTVLINDDELKKHGTSVVKNKTSISI